MKDYIAVLPSIYPEWTERCLDSLAVGFGGVLVVDNTVENKGVAASWNIGVRRLLESNEHWLIIMSAACRFGHGGLDFVAELDRYPDAVAVEAAHGIGWHLIAFHRRAFQAVGLFDENFYPAYFEDLDFAQRIALGFDLDVPYWQKVSVDVAIAGFAHGVDLGHAVMDTEKLRSYYRRKWGTYPGELEAVPFTKPFGDKPLDYWPAPTDQQGEDA